MHKLPFVSIFLCLTVFLQGVFGEEKTTPAAGPVVRFHCLNGPALSPESAAGFEKYYAGDLDFAEKLFAEARKKNPAEAAAWFGLHGCAWLRGLAAESRRCLFQALRVSAGDPWSELYLYAAETDATYASDDKEYVELLTSVSADQAFSPYLRDRAREQLADWFDRRGLWEEAASLWAASARLTDWALIGPFDNRDKSGFDVQYGPEKELDFDGVETGRNRKVRWFRPEVAPCDGRFPLEEIFDPPKHSLAYAVIFVKSESAAWAVLQVGYAGALKAFFNDVEVLCRPGYHEFYAAKDAVPIYLQAGWNKLLIKSAAYETPRWGFSARIAKPEGGVFPQLTFSSQKEAAAEYKLAKQHYIAPLIEPEKVELGLSARLREEARRLPNDAVIRAYCGRLLQHTRWGDAEDASHSEYFEKAAELAPRSPAFAAYVASGVKDANTRRQAAERLMRDFPDLTEGWNMGAAQAWAARMHARAEDYAEEALRRFSLERLPEAGEVMVRLLSVRDKRAEAERLAKKLVAAFPFLPGVWFAAEETQPSKSASRKILERALEYCGGEAVVFEQWLGVLNELGRELEVAERRLRLLKRHPASPVRAMAAAEALRRIGKADAAAKVTFEARRVAPEQPELLDLAGRLSVRLGDTAQAAELWREALRVRPNMPQLRDRLNSLVSQGGVDRSFFEAYDVALKDLPPLDEKKYARDYRVTLLNQGVVRVNPNGTAQKMVHVIAKVLRPEGVKALRRHAIYYDQMRQTLDILRAVVISPDGRETARAFIQDRSVSSGFGPGTMIYDEYHLREVFFRDLEPGSIIDLQYVLRDAGENIYGDYFADVFFFGDDQPTVRSQYVLDVPKSRTFKMRAFRAAVPLSRPPGKDPEREALSWELRDLPGLETEGGMPPLQDILPFVQITSKATWHEVGRWYWALARDQLKGDDALRSKVAELTDGLETDTEKLRAIHDWVIREIRYLGIEFGRNGYQPHRVETTLKALYGDCKDTAALMVAMLREAGIEARMVLLRTVPQGRVEPDCLPAPNLFNHCIAYVPDADGREYWIDGTTDYHALGEVPYADEGAQVLVVEENGGRFMTIPTSSAAQNRVARDVRISLEKDADPGVFVREVCTGQFGPFYRTMAATPGQYKRRLTEIASRRFPGSVIQRIDHAAADAPGDMWTEIEFTAPQLLSGGARKTVPACWEPLELVSRYAQREQRSMPLELWFQRSNLLKLTCTLGAKLKAAELPREVELKESFARYVRRVEKNDLEVRVTEEFALLQQRIAVADYPKFRAFCAQVDALQEEKIILEDK
jgi:tetratricopeptide (TPR) repeat protein